MFNSLELIELAAWLAETTICSTAQALNTVWPFLKGKAEQWVIPMAEMKDEDVKVLELLDPDTYKVLAILNRSRRKELPESVLLKRANVKQSLLEDMLKQGWIKKVLKFSRSAALNTARQAGKTMELSLNDERLQQPGPSEVFIDNRLELSLMQQQAVQGIWDSYQCRNGEPFCSMGLPEAGKPKFTGILSSKFCKKAGCYSSWYRKFL
jgi:primosomal protein N' (replication factor Y)